MNPSASVFSIAALASAAGTPWVAWAEVDQGNGLFLSHWNGSAWIADGGSFQSFDPGDLGPFVSLAVGPDGFPAVGWVDILNPTAHVAHWDGARINVDPPLNVGTLGAARVTLAYGSDGLLYAAHTEPDPNQTHQQLVYVQQRVVQAGTASWVVVGGQPVDSTVVTGLRLAMDGTTPYVAYGSRQTGLTLGHLRLSATWALSPFRGPDAASSFGLSVIGIALASGVVQVGVFDGNANGSLLEVQALQ